MTAKLQRPQRSRKLTAEQITRLEEGLRELGIDPGEMDPDDLLRQIETSAEFASAPVDDTEAQLPAAKERKRRQNRESEENRRQVEKVTGKARRVRGFRASPGGFLVETEPPPKFEPVFATPTPEDLARAEALRRLADAATQPLDPDEVIAATPKLERKLRQRRGQVPLRTLERLRAAYCAAFTLPPTREWERSFRSVVKYALRYRLAGGKPQPPNLKALLTGRGILSFLRRHFGDSVPPALTAERIDALLRTSTLARGGRGRKNADQAVDQLLEELKQTREV